MRATLIQLQKIMKVDFKKLNIETDSNKKSLLDSWEKLFIEYNSHTNLMSKNDIQYLYEKHVFDSLAINLWDKFKDIKTILDVGCGGGFPSLLLAIFFPDKKIVANDSRIKKINFIELVKSELKLNNLEILYSRIEDAPIQNIDLITSRAVGSALSVYELSKKHLKKEGFFLIYKSKKIDDEIKEFKKKYKNANFETISYNLPLEENYERNLLILKNMV